MDIEEAVARAEKAARSGDAWETVKHLFDPLVLGRVRARLRRSWGWISDDQIDDATVDAYLALYQEISAGGVVRRPVAWLASVAYRRAADTMRRTSEEDTTDPAEVSRGLVADPSEEARTRAAFTEFERLVDRLNPAGVRAVMKVVLDAYRSGIYTLTNREIAEILAEHPENVKKWRQRGFGKLGRLAQETGLVGPDFRLNYLALDPNDNDLDEENDG